jgi:tetratricopeptide (TPR) repeat protein
MDSLQKFLDQLEGAADVEFPKMRGSVEPQILQSQNAALICQLGAIYRERKLWSEAEEVLQKAARLEPSLPNPHRSLGLLFIHRDDLAWEESLERAKRSLETAVRLEKLSLEPSAATHTLLGRVHLSLGDRSRAESEFRVALSIDPHYTEATYNLAMTLGQLLEPPIDEIVNLLKQSITEDPHYFPALRDLGWQLRDADLKEAEHYLSRALQEAQDDVLVHIYWARLKFKSDPAVAEEHYKRAIQLDPGDCELHRLLGLFYQHHGRDRDANRELFLAVESDPKDPSAINAYVGFLRELGDRDAARNLFQSVTSGSLLPASVIGDISEKAFGSGDSQ